MFSRKHCFVFVLTLVMTILVLIGLFRPVPFDYYDYECEIEGRTLVQIGLATYEVSSEQNGFHTSKSHVPVRDKVPLSVSNEYQRPFLKICPSKNLDKLVANDLTYYGPPKEHISSRHLPVAGTIFISAPRDNKESKDLFSFKNWNLERASLKDGPFLEFVDNYLALGATPFVQEDAKIMTPSGNPVMFACYQNLKKPRECFTWWVDENGNSITLTFFDSEYDSSEWLDLYLEVKRQIKMLER